MNKWRVIIDEATFSNSLISKHVVYYVYAQKSWTAVARALNHYSEKWKHRGLIESIQVRAQIEEIDTVKKLTESMIFLCFEETGLGQSMRRRRE